MTELLIDIVGWVGSLMLVAAYWLISKGLLQAKTLAYQLMNLLGSIFLLVNAYYYGAYPSTAVNVIWIFIGIYWIRKIKQNTTKEG